MTTIAVTPGEPAGVGPDLTLELARHAPCRVVAVADQQMLAQRAQVLSSDVSLVPFDPDKNGGVPSNPPTLEVLDVPTARPVECGRLDPANATYVLETLAKATKGCLHQDFDALSRRNPASRARRPTP